MIHWNYTTWLDLIAIGFAVFLFFLTVPAPASNAVSAILACRSASGCIRLNK